ncbi:MAG TPA: hypothetical protein VGJ15_08895 [Pirellulales bacterium]
MNKSDVLFMAKIFPLKMRKAFWPSKSGQCGACKKKIEGDVVYLNAGAICDIEKSTIKGQEAFWNCGILTSEPEHAGSFDLEILLAPNVDQFELSFCSTHCLKAFFLTIINAIESGKNSSKKSQRARRNRKAARTSKKTPNAE